MAEERARDYLAARILTEGQPVTYRLLSRAIKVDVNTAKWMLFDFHKHQNAKKPNSVHATYLVTGKKHTDEQAEGKAGATNGTSGKHGEDVNMRSSPFMSSMPEAEEEDDESDEEPVKQTTILLVREEELQGASYTEHKVHQGSH